MQISNLDELWVWMLISPGLTPKVLATMFAMSLNHNRVQVFCIQKRSMEFGHEHAEMYELSTKGQYIFVYGPFVFKKKIEKKNKIIIIN